MCSTILYLVSRSINPTSLPMSCRLADEHQIEAVGETLRDMRPWIKAGALVDKNKK